MNQVHIYYRLRRKCCQDYFYKRSVEPAARVPWTRRYAPDADFAYDAERAYRRAPGLWHWLFPLCEVNTIGSKSVARRWSARGYFNELMSTTPRAKNRAGSFGGSRCATLACSRRSETGSVSSGGATSRSDAISNQWPNWRDFAARWKSTTTVCGKATSESWVLLFDSADDDDVTGLSLASKNDLTTIFTRSRLYS